MRSDRWRSQATRAAAPAVPGAGIHHSVIPIALRPARPGLRAALLASVCVGALAVVPATAQVSGTWTGGGAPVTNEWTQGNNWSSNPNVPDTTATFTNNGAPTSVTISNTTSIGTIQFTSIAPAYSFTVNLALFEINGSGIVNSSASAPSFTNNGAITFTNSSSAGNSAITSNSLFTLSFTDTSTAGSATITSNGALTQFTTNSNGGSARFITDAAGAVDFSGTSGPSGNHQITAGSIEGAGTYFLGSNQLTVGSNNLSTTVSGEIQDGGSGASLVKVGTGTLTLSGNNSYTGATTISAGTLVAASSTALPGQTALAVNFGAALIIDDGVSAQIGSLADGTSGGGTVQIGTSNSTTLLTVAAGSTTTFSGAFSGAGSIELDNGSLTLTGASNGGNIGSIGGDLSLCNCDNGGVTISGGSFTVGGNVEIEHGTLAVTNGGSLQTTDILVAGNMIVTGSGSTVTGHVTVVGWFGPGALTIANGGVFNSQGGVEIDTYVPQLGIPSVLVTGAGSTWNVGGPALFVGNGTSGGPGMLTVANGGTVNSTAPITIGDVTGASSVTVTGAGSVLNALNSLSIGGTGCGCGPLLGTLTIADGGVVNSPGSTTITAGSTLNLGTGGLAGAIVTPAIANNGQIVANFTDTLTLGAAISGSGSLSKAGAGTLILTGNSTYSGGTTITGGTLQLGNGGASGSIAGNVTNNGTFAINRSDTFTFGGIISGSGAFQQNGAGTTIFTAANTYTGGTTINAGTLQLGSGGSLAPTGALTVNAGGTFNLNSFNQTVGDLSGMGAIALGSGTLTAGTANSTTFGGAVSGTGGLVKQGSGALTLSGASSYTGTTNINAGTLVVNGSLASNVFVNAGGTLRGTGSIGSLVVGNGAALSPGNSIGRLTVNGNLVMASAAAYIVEVSSAAADRTNVTGTASLGGAVQLAFLSGTVAHSYTILSAVGGLNGTTFGALTTTNLPSNFTPSLSYTATDVILNFTARLGGPGFSINQQNVATALNNFFNNGGTLPPGFVSVFGLTGGNLANALTLLSGEAATGGQQAAFQLTNQFLGLMGAA
jgi:autotransporter-associated beta strand protein/T5SS/PEP-CTERM-associated repeat protein